MEITSNFCIVIGFSFLTFLTSLDPSALIPMLKRPEDYGKD
jgi:hypothetical protein